VSLNRTYKPQKNQSISSRQRPNLKATQSPARTTPPTSLFLPMQLSNSKKAVPSISPELTTSNTFRAAFVKQKRPKNLRPRLSAGRSPLEKVSKAKLGPPQERAKRSASAAYRPRPYSCQRTFTKNSLPADRRAIWRRLKCIFMPPRGRSVTRC
jgi:hypothetical protein